MLIMTVCRPLFMLQMKGMEKYIWFGEAKRQKETLPGISHYPLQLGRRRLAQDGISTLWLSKQTI